MHDKWCEIFLIITGNITLICFQLQHYILKCLKGKAHFELSASHFYINTFYINTFLYKIKMSL